MEGDGGGGAEEMLDEVEGGEESWKRVWRIGRDEERRVARGRWEVVEEGRMGRGGGGWIGHTLSLHERFPEKFILRQQCCLGKVGRIRGTEDNPRVRFWFRPNLVPLCSTLHCSKASSLEMSDGWTVHQLKCSSRKSWFLLFLSEGHWASRKRRRLCRTNLLGTCSKASLKHHMPVASPDGLEQGPSVSRLCRRTFQPRCHHQVGTRETVCCNKVTVQ